MLGILVLVNELPTNFGGYLVVYYRSIGEICRKMSHLRAVL